MKKILEEWEGTYEVDGEEYWVSDYDTAYDEAVEECEQTFDELGLEAVTESTQEYFLENEDYEGAEDEMDDDDVPQTPAGASPLNFFS